MSLDVVRDSVSPHVHQEETMAYDPEELENRGEIARRLGVKPRTVTIWTQRAQAEHAAKPFPAPASGVGQRGRIGQLWRWGDVARWNEERGGSLSAGPRARLAATSGPAVGLDPREITRLRRELVAVAKRLAQCEADRARQVELWAILHDQGGLDWQQLGDISGGISGAGVRKAVERSRGTG